MRNSNNFVSGSGSETAAYFFPEVRVLQFIAREVGGLAVKVLKGEARSPAPCMSPALK